ncbi:MAG: UDP-3-O-(3-hydroxymyristoyl)glucosamine N-acyltransferase [Bacteroidales bacterium]|nr:UDP-3-O-(3-hydroxymyristoyl)glucosamine N-acyltransferase [Bacteroidales bacterium]
MKYQLFMEFSARQIAELLGGVVEGDPQVRVSGLARIEEGKAGSLSFLANPKYTPYLYSTASSIVIINHDFVPERKVQTTLIRVPDAYAAFAQLLELYQQTHDDRKGVASLAFCAPGVQLGEEVYIGEFSYIGNETILGREVKVFPQVYIGENCQIGQGTVIYPGVKIYAGTQIGNNCIIHAGCVIGADGFGFASQTGNTFTKVPQTGIVIIEDHVEIGANTTIDRATIGATIIRQGVKLDNLIQIAHNVEVGENTVMAAQTGVSGSTKIGANCMFGGQVGLAGHITIADEVKLAAQSGVASHIRQKGAVMMGSPVIPFREYTRVLVHFKNLNKWVEKVQELERRLNELAGDTSKADEK